MSIQYSVLGFEPSTHTNTNLFPKPLDQGSHQPVSFPTFIGQHNFNFDIAITLVNQTDKG